MDIKYLAESFDQAKAATVLDDDVQCLHELRWLGYDRSGLPESEPPSPVRFDQGAGDA